MSRPRPSRARPEIALVVALTTVALAACTGGSPDPTPQPSATLERPEPPVETATGTPSSTPEPDPRALASYGVSAGHPAAVEAAIAVLDEGGNAVDAAVAAAFAVSVVEPFASGIGGGGAALVVAPGQDPISYDYREVVPAGGVDASDAGVPGFVAGLEAMHTEHGTLDWARLLEPAETLAREGHPVSQMLADQLRTGTGEAVTGRLDQFQPGGRPLSEGDTLVQPALAATLKTLGSSGAASFYGGGIGETLTDAVPGIDGSSLEGYEVQVSEPPSGAVGDLEVVSAAPALPGVALIQTLQVAEALGIADMQPGSDEYLHTLAKAWERGAQTVETSLGDPDFVDVPVDRLTDAAANAQVAASIAGEGASSTSHGLSSSKTGETTHITVVDADGLTVSMTNTLTYFWGSGQYVGGYFLNNQMVRFSVGGSGGSNDPQPGRRSVSWSMPTVVLDDEGRPVLGIGSPGGERIPMVLADVIVRWGLRGQGLDQAIAAPRFSAKGGEIELEELPSRGIQERLRGQGWTIEGPVPRNLYAFGSVQSLAVDWETGEITGAADTRREADVAIRATG